MPLVSLKYNGELFLLEKLVFVMRILFVIGMTITE